MKSEAIYQYMDRNILIATSQYTSLMLSWNLVKASK